MECVVLQCPKENEVVKFVCSPHLNLCMSSQKANAVDAVPGTDEIQKKAVLEVRRVMILALVGGTPKSNLSVDRVLETEYLSEVKNWLEEILKEYIGMFRQHMFPINHCREQRGLTISSSSQAAWTCCFIF